MDRLPFSRRNCGKPRALPNPLLVLGLLQRRGFITLRCLFRSVPCLSVTDRESLRFLSQIAEDELVDIVPNMRMEPLHMICGDFGPFLPQMAARVPFWLAVALKKRGKCTVRPPEWMSVENSTWVLEADRDSEKEFQTLPFHYIEISRLLFTSQISY
ncbi:hypothetical protein MLD38_009773 [Melastoma candidum]|uniref:Uncharacterized protein n=1 Tax=Melastoma candidum TaxID=119954 RepID=A0ACB9RY94_9MYRT|nr:hypothetical protein MLD38_009773 [Melastoma candidum]